MLKNSFKQFLKFILVMVFSSLLATSASSATIEAKFAHWYQMRHGS